MLELYHNNISVCAHLSLARGEHLTPEFKALNPRGRKRTATAPDRAARPVVTLSARRQGRAPDYSATASDPTAWLGW